MHKKLPRNNMYVHGAGFILLLCCWFLLLLVFFVCLLLLFFWGEGEIYIFKNAHRKKHNKHTERGGGGKGGESKDK